VNTCGTCKHWESGFVADDGWGICNRIIGPGDDKENEVVHAQDASDFRASVRCKAAFGCVLWEAK